MHPFRPPEIVIPLTNQTKSAESRSPFRGSPRHAAFAFEWHKDGKPITGAKNPILELGNVSWRIPGNMASRCAVPMARHPASTHSRSCRARCHQQSEGSRSAGRDDVSFSVKPSAPRLWLRWFKNDVNIPGASGPTFSFIEFVNLTRPATAQRSSMNSDRPRRPSSSSVLFPTPPPVVTLHPKGQSVLPGASVQLPVAASASHPSATNGSG